MRILLDKCRDVLFSVIWWAREFFLIVKYDALRFEEEKIKPVLENHSVNMLEIFAIICICKEITFDGEGEVVADIIDCNKEKSDT